MERARHRAIDEARHAKLVFRENAYPDSSDDNPYLGLLAQGEYMGRRAKARYPDGVQLAYEGGVAADSEATR